MIELAVLDMAGTTVSDDGVVEASFLAAIRGLDLTAGEKSRAVDIVRETMGMSKIEVLRMIFPGDEEAANAANKAFEEVYAIRVEDGSVEPLPGAEFVLKELRSRGIKVVFTTGFSPQNRDFLLAHLGWDVLTDLALSPGDVGRGRPYPDMILHAVLRLGVSDVSAVAVAGDNPADLEAGTRAGASIVAGVLTGASDQARLATARHTHIINSISEFPGLIGYAA